MSAPDRPDGKPAAGSPAGGDAGKRSTVGVYDRPESADRPSMLPKIITAVIVVVMLVLTWLFWPKAAAAATPASAQPTGCMHAQRSEGLPPSEAAARGRLATADAPAAGGAVGAVDANGGADSAGLQANRLLVRISSGSRRN